VVRINDVVADLEVDERCLELEVGNCSLVENLLCC
jgi:hypothetical protein